MDKVEPQLFLSKLCEKTFANYAFTQIKKAYGLEKKIVNPVDEHRKSMLSFCYVHANKNAVSLEEFLIAKGWQQENVGLSIIPHMKDCYNVFYSTSLNYSGVIRKENANEVALSNIPKDEQPIGVLYFNKDGYFAYCKKHKEYWEWIEEK